MITEQYNGKTFQVVYTESILTLHKESVLQFKIITDDFYYLLIFHFLNEGEPFTSTYGLDDAMKFISVNLFRWDSDSWAENTDPIELRIRNDLNKYYLKFRNHSNANYPSRKFEVTVWKEL